MLFSLNKDKIKIILFEGIHENAVKNFQNSGYTQVKLLDYAPEEEELIELIKDAHVVGIRSRTQLNRNVLEKAMKLLAIGNFCIGTNQVDLDLAKEFGIPVFNAPLSNTRSVAELVIAESVMLMRGIPEKNALAHIGKWKKSSENSYELRGKTIGIVGHGHIGTQVSVLAQAFGMTVCFYDLESKLNIGNAQRCNTLEELLGKSDVVTLHVPGCKQTENLIGEKEIGQMKAGSHLINASRGNVVDISALAEALKSGHLLGAAIDVFPVEPASKNDEFVSELRQFDNVILTPHIGGSTLEAQFNISLEVSDKLIKYSDNGTTSSAVNFPQASLPSNEGKRRFLHIHNNKPGVLSAVNHVFTDKGINVAAQYLQTDSQVGYVVVDVDDDKVDISLLKELKNIEHTIRARMLY